jgi:hypothetical protein
MWLPDTATTEVVKKNAHRQTDASPRSSSFSSCNLSMMTAEQSLDALEWDHSRGAAPAQPKRARTSERPRLRSRLASKGETRMSDAVANGKVEWSGENPFIYLKTDAEADWSVLALNFRITVSDHGLGHAIVVLEEPYRKDAPSESVRICITDNMPLARFLVDSFVRHFAVFRGAVALDSMVYLEGSAFSRGSDGDTYTESGRAIGAGPEVTLSWESPGAPFAVDVPPAGSGTGRHEMFSVFRTADGASIVVDGRRLPGHPVVRDFFGARSKSAGLAFSETWVLPA